MTFYAYNIEMDVWTQAADLSDNFGPNGGSLLGIPGTAFLYAIPGSGAQKFLKYERDTVDPSVGTVADEGVYSGSVTTLSVSATSFSDAETSIATYVYSVGTSAGSTNTLVWTENGASANINITSLNLTSGTQYFVNVRALDTGANVTTVASTNGITVDTAAPTGLSAVTDDGQFTASTTTLSASWPTATDPLSGLAEYSYSIGTSAGDISVRGWTTNGTTTNVSATGLNLASGTQYFINVRAKDNLGNLTAVASSNGITVDTSAPSDPSAVTDDGQFTASATTLSASWTASADALSAVTEYSYSIGISAGDISVRGWTTNGTNTSVSATGLNLTSGTQYFINVRAKNGAGSLSNAASSNGITVDTAAPTGLSAVTDDGQFTTSTTTLSASWPTATDALSGLAEYSYSIGTSAGDISVRGWTTNGTTTNVSDTGLNLTSGTQYFINVRAKDNVGNLTAVASSDGITVDTAAPSDPSAVTDDGQFTTSATTLSASWTAAADAVSAVTEYSYSIGISAGDISVRGWTTNGTTTNVSATGLNLTSGTQYFINVRAKNGAGLLSNAASSDGITVDTSAPSDPSAVTDDGQFTTSATTLNASWTTSADAVSGVTEYSYSIGTSLGGTEVRDWTTNGTNTSVSATGLNLASGTQYFINVRAKNGAGLLSNAASSDGITVDTSLGNAVANLTDIGQFTTSTTTLTASWTAPQVGSSGVAAYSVSLFAQDGTRLGQTSVQVTNVTFSDLNLTSGVTYTITVQVVTGVGTVGPAVSTDGVMVDTSPPAITGLADGVSQTALTAMSASWTSATDAQSGVTALSAELRDATGTVISQSALAVAATSVTFTGLNLAVNSAYTIHLRAVNGAGLSADAATDGVQVVVRLGDINEDGRVDEVDLELVADFVLGITQPTAQQSASAKIADPAAAAPTLDDVNLVGRCAYDQLPNIPAYAWCPNAAARQAGGEP